MDVLDKFFKKFSYKFPKGYPDINDEQDMLMLEGILEDLDIDISENRQINSNTKQAIAYIIDKADPSLGFKTQTDIKRLANPNKIEPEKVQQLFKDILGAQTFTIHSPRTGPNPSGKFDMYEFDTTKFGKIQIILSGGGNRGEKYEQSFVNNAKQLAGQPNDSLPPYLQTLYNKLGIDNTKLTSEDVKFAGTTSTKRSLSLEGPKNIGKIVSDVTIEYEGQEYFISLKNKQGSGLYSGKTIPFIYEKEGQIIYDPSKIIGGTDIDTMFDILNIDSEKLAKGLNNYINKEGTTDSYSPIKIDEIAFKKLLSSSFGYGYYYVQESGKDQVKVTPLLTPEDAIEAIGNIKKTEIKYPGPNTKQLTMNVYTDSKLLGSTKYSITIRNTSGKILPLSLRISKL